MTTSIHKLDLVIDGARGIPVARCGVTDLCNDGALLASIVYISPKDGTRHVTCPSCIERAKPEELPAAS